MADEPRPVSETGDDLEAQILAALESPEPSPARNEGGGTFDRLKGRAAAAASGQVGFAARLMDNKLGRGLASIAGADPNIFKGVAAAMDVQEAVLTSNYKSKPAGFIDDVADVGFQVVAAPSNVAHSIANLADSITGQELVPDEMSGAIDSENMVAAVAGGVAQFALPYAGASKAVGAASKGFTALKGSNAARALVVSAGESWGAQTALRLGEKTLSATLGTKVGRTLTAGAIADFVAWNHTQQNMSSTLREFGGMGDNVVTRFLATDKEDPWWLNRVRNVLEGGILGAAMDAAIGGVKKGIRGKQNRVLESARKLNRAVADGNLLELEPLLTEAEKASRELHHVPADPHFGSDGIPLAEATTPPVPMASETAFDGGLPLAPAKEPPLRAISPEPLRKPGEKELPFSPIASNDPAVPLTSAANPEPVPPDLSLPKTPADAKTPLGPNGTGADPKITHFPGDGLKKPNGEVKTAAPKYKPLPDGVMGPAPAVHVSANRLKHEVEQAVKRGIDPHTALQEGHYLHINYGRLRNPKDAEAALRAIEPATQPIIDGQVGAVRSLAEAKKMAEETGIESGELLKWLERDTEAATALGPRMIAYRTERNTIAHRAADAANRLANNMADPVAREELIAEQMNLGMIDTHYGMLQKSVARALGEQRVVAGTRQAKSAERVAQILKEVSEQSEGVKEAIQAAADGNTRFREALEGKLEGVQAEQIVRTIATTKKVDVVPHVLSMFRIKDKSLLRKAIEVHNEYWQAAILSGMKTYAVNFVSNALNTMVMPAERFIGATVTGNRAEMKAASRFGMELVGGVYDFLALWRTSDLRSSVGKALKTERPVLDPTSVSREVEHFAIPGKVGQAVRLPFRINGTVDEFFKQLNYRAYIRTQARQEAEQLGINGDALVKFVNNRLAQGFTATGSASIKDGRFMFEAAAEWAREATFSQELLEGTIGKSLHGMVSKHPTLRIVLPFVRTPTNIFRKAVRLTPGINLLQAEYRSRLVSDVPEVRARARGELLTGAAIWTAAIVGVQGGYITGGGPVNKAERDVLTATGWRPYSFAVEGEDGKKTYYSYLRFDPMAMVLGLAADSADVWSRLDEGEASDLAGGMVMALGRNLTNKTYMKSLRDTVDLLAPTDERYAERWLKARVASYVPSILGGVAVGDDDYLRETRTVLDAIRRKIPGYSDTLPPRRNILGEPITPDPGFIPFVDTEHSAVARMVSPAAYSRSVDDDVKSELARLSYGFSMPAKKIGGVDLTLFRSPDGQDAYDHFVEQHGKVRIGGRTLSQSLNALIHSKAYKRLPDPEGPQDSLNPKVRAVQEVFSNYRERAKAMTLKSYPELARAIRESAPAARPAARRSSLLSRLN